MKLFESTKEIPPDLAGSVIAIGNFDGVHRGHLAVLNAAAKQARQDKVPLTVLTFEPHPRRFLRPDTEHFGLTTLKLKCRLLEILGVEAVFAARFDQAFAGLTAAGFIKQVLVDELAVRHVVTGENFFFGKGRQGDTALLAKLCADNGIGATAVATAKSAEPGTGSGEIFSSTRVREALKQGDPRSAAELLGHWWSVTGEVRRGDQRGRDIGFPTANIVLDHEVRPRYGVYVVRARDSNIPDAPVLNGVANLGLRPTFARDHAVLEVHLLDFDGDLYGRELLVEVLEFLRPEQKFDGLESLKKQIAADAQAARRRHGRLALNGDPMARYPIGLAFAPDGENGHRADR